MKYEKGYIYSVFPVSECGTKHGYEWKHISTGLIIVCLLTKKDWRFDFKLCEHKIDKALLKLKRSVAKFEFRDKVKLLNEGDIIDRPNFFIAVDRNHEFTTLCNKELHIKVDEYQANSSLMEDCKVRFISSCTCDCEYFKTLNGGMVKVEKSIDVTESKLFPPKNKGDDNG